MTKQQLIEEIEGYAAAKATGNITLIQRQAAVLKQALDALPDNLDPPAPAPAPLPPAPVCEPSYESVRATLDADQRP